MNSNGDGVLEVSIAAQNSEPCGLGKEPFDWWRSGEGFWGLLDQRLEGADGGKMRMS